MNNSRAKTRRVNNIVLFVLTKNSECGKFEHTTATRESNVLLTSFNTQTRSFNGYYNLNNSVVTFSFYVIR